MAKLTLKNETLDPAAPPSDHNVLYPKGDEYFYRRSDGIILRLAGSSILFGSGAPAGSLGKISDFYEDTLTGDVYEKTGVSAWTLRDNLTGPTGPIGPTGPQGAPGAGAPASDTTPAEIADSTGIPGVSGSFSRGDHTHAHGNRGGGSLHAVATTSVSGFLSASDKTKLDGVALGATNTPLSVTAPINVSKSAAVAGVSSEAARQDHKHDIDTAVPVAVGSANTEGSSSSLARADHIHAHGNQVGGSLHALATTSANGFMGAADKTKLDGLANTDPFSELSIVDHFVSGNEDTDEIAIFGWRNSFAGTGNAFGRINGEVGHPGIVRLVGGTVDTGRQCLHLGENTRHALILGGGTIRFSAGVRLTGVLSQHEMTVAGLGDTPTTVGDQSNGIYFQLLGSPTPDTNWHLVCASGGVRTRRDTGVAFSSGAWLKIEFEVNAAATSVQAYINGIAVGSPITTNIPTVPISPLFKTDAIAAGVATPFDIDIFKLKQVFSTPW